MISTLPNPANVRTTLHIPPSWWDAATPETRATVRSAALAEVDERTYEFESRHTGPLLARLLRDVRQAQTTIDERPEQPEPAPTPDPGTKNVVKRSGRRKKDA